MTLAPPTAELPPQVWQVRQVLDVERQAPALRFELERLAEPWAVMPLVVGLGELLPLVERQVVVQKGLKQRVA